MSRRLLVGTLTGVVAVVGTAAGVLELQRRDLRLAFQLGYAKGRADQADEMVGRLGAPL